MAWGATFDVSDTSTDFYDQAMQKLVAEVTHGIPEGCIVHIMSPTDDGYRVTEVWESEEHWQRFRNDILTPLLQRLVGEESLEQPDPTALPCARRQGSIYRVTPAHQRLATDRTCLASRQ